MANVQGAANLAAASKHVAEAGAAKAMETGMKGMMMGEGMSGMMGGGMPGMMGAGAVKAAPAAVSFHNVAKGAATTGVAVTAASRTGKSLVGRLVRNPWVLFGLGITVGYMVHKYRKNIIGAANRVAEKGKDFVLQQRENLEDIVAESSESED